MRIVHNMQALNANRQLGSTTSLQSKSSEKLSSGYRINRAADDAAGLSISEKMRQQIRGLAQSSKNSQDGISLIQTAEGSLNEVHSMLQRMSELATQAANGTNTSVDKGSLNDEVQQLKQEINRVSKDTEFNEMKLFSGNFHTQLQVGANNGQNITMDIANMSLKGLGLSTWTYTGMNFTAIKEDGKLKLKDGFVYGTGEQKALTSKLSTATKLSTTAKNGIYKVVNNKSGKEIYFMVASTDGTGNIQGKSTNEIAALLGFAKASHYSTGAAANSKVGRDVILSKLTFGFTVKDAKKSGRTAYGIKAGIDTVSGANKMLDIAKSAIKTVSKTRSSLGALQNRLEHTIASLDTSNENLTAAESRIRDVDMAKEMVDYTKNNILIQAGQSMLAQANQSTQGVLSLLQ